MTGPEIIKILAPTPKIYPSVLNSKAGDTTEFANPVMGTSVPAPACFAIFSYIPSPVSKALITISVIETKADASFFVSPI